MILKKKLILASSSPRRVHLLEALGLTFEVKKIDFIETFPQELPPKEVPVFISKQKANQLPAINSDEYYITADTIVVCENTVIGKPSTTEDAIRLLTMLSDNTHTVVTGVCIKSTDFEVVFSEETSVTFFPLTEDEIKKYITTFQPLDKAGAYGIQEWIGHIGIKKIDGNFDNVVGLPASRLFQELKKLNLFQ